MNNANGGHKETSTTPTQSAINLSPDILRVLEETRDGAMEEISEIGDYISEVDKEKCLELILKANRLLINQFVKNTEWVTFIKEMYLSCDLNYVQLNEKNSLSLTGILLLMKEYDLLHEIIEAGANPNATYRGIGLIEMAFDGGNWEEVLNLIKLGADPNIPMSKGYNILQRLVVDDATEKVLNLLSTGKVDIDMYVTSESESCSGLTGRTSLMFAAANDRFQTTLMLLNFGANPNLRDKIENQTAYDIAKIRMYDKVAQIIMSNPRFERSKNGIIGKVSAMFNSKKG